nr:putative ribonuclease H-like domain-containing protein [Tanacetum cinerariifolium]
MDQDSAYMMAASKVPMLKPVTTVIKGVETIIAPATAEEKVQRSGYDWNDKAEDGPTNIALMECSTLSSDYEEPVVKTSEAKASADKPKDVRKNFSPPVIEDWISDSEDEAELTPKIEKKTVKPSFTKIEFLKSKEQGNPQMDLQEKGVIDSGCSRHMIANMSYHTDYEEINGGYVAFGGNPKGGKITGKGTIRTGKLYFENVYFVKELKFNLFSVSQMYDKKNSVLFTDTKCVVLSPDFKLPDENQVLLRVSIRNNMYSVDLKNIILKRCLTCLFEMATSIESRLWHRRLGHLNFKTMNKLVKENLPVVAGTQSNSNASTKDNNVGQARKEKEPGKDYILLPLWTANPPFPQESKSSQDAGFKPSNDVRKKVNEVPRQENECNDQKEKDSVNNTNRVNAVSSTINDASNEVNVVSRKSSIELFDDPNMPELEDISIFEDSNEDDHPLEQVIRELHLAHQIRRMSKNLEEHGLVSAVNQRTNHKYLQNCLFAWFLSQMGHKKVTQVLKDPSWIEAMQEELLQFKLQEVWTVVDLPYGKRAIGSKWVFKNKLDKREIMIRNKARLVAKGHTQEEGIDYAEIFAPVAKIKAIRLFLAYASFNDFIVYQMDVKSVFIYGKIKEEVYVCQPPGFEDPDFPDKVYKVEKALYGLHNAPRAWYDTLSTYLLDNWFQRGKIDKTLFIRRHKGDILLVQVYVDNIIFGSTKKELFTSFKKVMHDKF